MADEESSHQEVAVKYWVDKRRTKEPVAAWLRQLDLQSLKQIRKLITMLKTERRRLGMPYVRHLGDGLFELRDQRQSGPGYRLYFCWESDVVVVLLVGGEKKSQAKDIDVARRRMSDEEE